MKWTIGVTIFAFIASLGLGYLSSEYIGGLPAWLALFLLVIVIFIGIIFDVIGLAVATGDEAPFHSMASKQVKGARQAVWLIRNAEKVSNFCNDVIGDITGIISGVAISAIIIFGDSAWVAAIMTSFVAAITIGFKAGGKRIALDCNKPIIFFVAKILYLFGVAKKNVRRSKSAK